MKSKQEKPSDVAPFNSMTTRSLPLGSKSTLNPESKKRFFSEFNTFHSSTIMKSER